MKTALITGCAGFVGTNLAMHLLKHGYHVLGVDKKDFNQRLQMSGLLDNEQFAFMELDLAAQALPQSLQPDILFHLAALPHVDYSKFHPSKSVRNNIESTLTVADFAAHHNVPVIFSSSVEVYGGAVDHHYTEDMPPRPLSPYAASKVGCEAIIHSYVETQGLQATIFRFTNLYGPWQLPDRLIPRVITQSILGDPVVIEKGTNRDFVYINEACDLLERAIAAPHTGEVYNLSSGNGIDNFYAVQEILRIIPNQTVTVRRPRNNDGRGKFLVASPHKLQQLMSWNPKVALAEGVAATCEWYTHNKDWWCSYTDQLRADRENDAFLVDSLHW